jgi:hypothetical protein
VLDSDLLFPLIIALQPIIFELMLSSVSSEQRYGIAKKRAEGISNFMLLFHDNRFVIILAGANAFCNNGDCFNE